MLRKEIREAVGTYEEIAKRFSVNKTTVWRIRKGRYCNSSCIYNRHVATITTGSTWRIGITETMAYTTTQLAAIEAAIATVVTVEIDNRRVTIALSAIC